MDAGINGDHAIRTSEKRVDVQFYDFGHLANQVRDAKQDLYHCVSVNGRLISVGVQKARHAGAVDQPVGQDCR